MNEMDSSNPGQTNDLPANQTVGEQAAAVNAKRDENIPLGEVLQYLRGISTYGVSLPQAVIAPNSAEDVASAQLPQVLEAELVALPAENHLMSYRHFDVYYGSATQLPKVLQEITRLRELTFREMQEGSGRAVDTDEFDLTYLHLFVWDNKDRAIVGGYRLGRTDELRQAHGPDGVYLGIMFDFDDGFYDGPPMMEIGRSFVAPSYQRNHYSLYLLWSGISRYLVQHPRYRRLYGVVSMSRLYDVRTLAAIRDALVEPVTDIRAKFSYEPDLGDAWREFVGPDRPLPMREVSAIVKALEEDQRDVPVLIRHYHKLGAKFLSAAVDGNFNNTPGLLLHLDVPKMPAKYMRQYFGAGGESYLAYKSD